MNVYHVLKHCQNTSLLEKHVTDTISCSSYTKGRFKGLSPGHCGYCVPCLIRRASISKAFGADATTYTLLPDLGSRSLDSTKAEGENIRSFQLMIHRLNKQPNVAKQMIRKPGPLTDYTAQELEEYEGVFVRGISEVGDIVKGVTVEPK